MRKLILLVIVLFSTMGYSQHRYDRFKIHYLPTITGTYEFSSYVFTNFKDIDRIFNFDGFKFGESLKVTTKKKLLLKK